MASARRYTNSVFELRGFNHLASIAFDVAPERFDEYRKKLVATRVRPNGVTLEFASWTRALEDDVRHAAATARTPVGA